MQAFGTRKKQQVNQCELLALLGAVMTFEDILRDCEVIVWVDNVPTLSAVVNGYSHAPEMAALSNALHLKLAGLLARPYFSMSPARLTRPTSPVACLSSARGQGLALTAHASGEAMHRWSMVSLQLASP